MTHFYALPLNAEPWTAPEASIGRRNRKIFVQMHKDAGVDAYQQAVGENLRELYPDLEMQSGPIGLTFYIWRQLAQYEGQVGKVTKHQADATNMQKALEDALQGVLFSNDRDVVQVTTIVVAQGVDVEPFIVIHAYKAGNLEGATEILKEHLKSQWPKRAAAAATTRAEFDVEGVF